MSSIPLKNLDIAVGLIKDIRQPIDQMQKELICDTGTYMMSVQWCDNNDVAVGKLLTLGYDGFYKCRDVNSTAVFK